MKKLRTLIATLVIVSGIVLSAAASPVGAVFGTDEKYYWFTDTGIYINYGTVPEEERRMDSEINSPARVVREDGYRTVKGVAPNFEPVGTPEVALYSKKNYPNDK